MATLTSGSRSLISPTWLARKSGRRVYWSVTGITIAVFTLVFIAPFYWMVTGALKSPQEYAQDPPTLVPHSVNLGNYADAWNQLNLGQLLLNTVIYAGGALAFALVFDVAAAYAFSKLRPVLGNVLLGGMLVTLMIPSTVLIVPQYENVISLPWVHWSLIDTPWAIWLPAVTNAFNIFLLKRFFDSIPEDLLAAAAIDGAGPLRTLWSVVLPISRPILGVVSIFAVTAVWKDFLWPLLVESGPTTKTLNVGLYAFSNGLSGNVVVAASVIAALPTIVFFLFFQRNIMSGLTAGSLKG